jgi:hypothetical protein
MRCRTHDVSIVQLLCEADLAREAYVDKVVDRKDHRSRTPERRIKPWAEIDLGA